MKAQQLILISLLSFLASLSGIAQVGINNENPHKNAELDIENPNTDNMGLMPPKGNLELIASSVGTDANATGLLMLDKETNKYYFFDGVTWQLLNPFKATVSNTTSKTVDTVITDALLVANGGLEVKGNLEVDGNLVIDGYSSNSLVPKGAIIMWSGTVAPSGWALCNGLNGTPNLMGRFIVGYDPSDLDYNNPGNLSTTKTLMGKTGPAYTDADGVSTGNNTQDAKEIKLTVGQMPSHDHSGQTDSNGAHTHTTRFRKGDVLLDGGKPGGLIQTNDDDASQGTLINDNTYYTSTNGIHTHLINAQGGNQAHENRPPYYTLAYIIKL